MKHTASPELLQSLRAVVPEPILELGHELRRAGLRAWFVGGTSRDLLRGQDPRDYDLALAAAPDELRRRLPSRAFLAEQPGEVYGTLRLRVDEYVIELTSLRAESGYADHRRPQQLSFVDDPELDAARRDFSINALYLDPVSGDLLDFHGGLQDLRQRRLCVLGEAEERFAEDPLRILRALRLAAQLDFVPDAACQRGLRNAAAGVTTLSGARVRSELERLLRSRGRARGLMLLVRAGVASLLVPGLAELSAVPQPPQYHPEGNVLQHTALVLANLSEPVDPRLAWAALFHDLGKRETFERAADRIRFHGHDDVSASRAEAWLLEHACPRPFVDDVVSVIREHIRIAALPQFRRAKQARFLWDPLFPLHLDFHRADCLASHRKLDLYETILALRKALPEAPPAALIRGRDLLALGFQPGPAIGQMLAAVQDARLEGQLSDREQALVFVQELASRDSTLPCSTPKREQRDKRRGER